MSFLFLTGSSLAAAVVVLGVGQAASADSLHGTPDGNTYFKSTGFAGGAFQSDDGMNEDGTPNTLHNDPSSSGGTLAREVFGSVPGEPLGLPSGSVRFAGIFEFDITGGAGFAGAMSDPSQDYRYDFSWNLTFNSGESVTTSHTFYGSVVANFHELNAGWVTDGNGNWYAAALYPNSGEGVFAWATESPADFSWWNDLDSEGKNRYDPSQPNSAYIENGGSLSISAVAVPTPSAALAGFGLLGITALRRRRAFA